MSGQPPRTKFTPFIDLALLKEVVNHNPFVDPTKWANVVDTLQEAGDGAPTTARSCRERVNLLMEYFKKDQLAKINKSGTDEEYTEREEILQEVVDLYNDRERIANTNKASPVPPTDIRKRAMETLKGDGPVIEDDKENLRNDASLQSPSCKRVRMSASMAKRDMLTYLETKSENIRTQQDKELEFRKEELALHKARFELEKTEREVNLEIDKQARAATQNLQEQEITLRREELQLNKAKFEIE